MLLPGRPQSAALIWIWPKLAQLEPVSGGGALGQIELCARTCAYLAYLAGLPPPTLTSPSHLALSHLISARPAKLEDQE